MKLFLIIQFILTLVGGLVLLEIRGGGAAASYVFGSSLILVNVGILAFVWFFVIQKKLIALSLSIIVFKYAILGVIIYKVLSYEWVDKGWLCVGLGSLVITTLSYGIFSPNKEDANGD